MSTFAPDYDFLKMFRLSENELVRELILHDCFLYSLFNFVLEPALGPPPRGEFGYAFFLQVRREELGLIAGRKPGDIDILIVPWTIDGPLVRSSMAIELKKLFISSGREDRGINSYGSAQCEGLLSDGFPCVGLLHLVAIEPDRDRRKTSLGVARIVGDGTDRVELEGERAVDHFTTEYVERQLGRIQRLNLPDSVGRNVVLLTTDAENSGIGVSLRRNVLARPTCQMSKELTSKIEKFIALNAHGDTIFYQNRAAKD